jgi:hypothetical protein
MSSNTPAESVTLSRRGIMTGSVALASVVGLASLATPSLAAPATASAMPVTPAERAAVVRRLRFRADAGPVFWWFRGVNYAVRDSVLTRICGLLFGSMMQLTPTADGGFDVVQYEVGFRTDPETGARLDAVRNPFTGEMAPVQYSPVGPTHMHYSADNVPQIDENIGGSKLVYEHRPEHFYRAGETLFLQYHAQSRVITPNRTDRIINDFGIIHGPAAKALDPKVAFAPAWIEGTDITDYPRWLKMPPGMGSQTLRSVGQKVQRYEDMPQDWRDMIAQADPEMARNPMGVFTRSLGTYRG